MSSRWLERVWEECICFYILPRLHMFEFVLSYSGTATGDSWEGTFLKDRSSVFLSTASLEQFHRSADSSSECSICTVAKFTAFSLPTQGCCTIVFFIPTHLGLPWKLTPSDSSVLCWWTGFSQTVIEQGLLLTLLVNHVWLLWDTCWMGEKSSSSSRQRLEIKRRRVHLPPTQVQKVEF